MVLPETVQTPVESELKVTGFPESPPVAATVYVPPNKAGEGGVDVNVIACG